MLFKRLENEFALQRKYIGHGNAIRRYRASIRYAESQVFTHDEHVLASIAVTTPPDLQKHMHGLLVATNKRLLFITSSIHYGSFFDVYPYDTIERLSMRRLRQTMLILRFRRMEKSYIAPFVDERLSAFRQVVRQKIDNSKDETNVS